MRAAWIGGLAALFAISSCLPSHPAAGGGEPGSWPRDADLISRYVIASWSDIGADAGGFSSPDFTAEPSLYATSWNLRSLRQLGRSSPGLDRRRVGRWLDG